MLPPSSGIGNGYSDSFESVGKLFHLDILPNGFLFIELQKTEINHSLTFHSTLQLMYQLNAQTVHDITIVTLRRHVSASQCHLQAAHNKLKAN
jgi:hypothetical protein